MKKKAIPVYLFSFFMIMPVTAVIPVLPVIRDELNASYSQISFFVACLGIVRIVLAFPGGFLVDKFDRKKILLMSSLLSLIGLLILSSSHTIFHLIVSRVLIGSGSIISVITVSVLLANIAGLERRGAMMSLIHVVNHAGVIVSAALTGILAGWYNWRLPFLVIAGLLLLSAVTVAVLFDNEALVYKGSRTRAGRGPEPFPKKKFKPGFLKLLPVFAISLFVFFYRSGFRHTLIPFYGKDVLHIDVMALGFYISMIGCIAMVSIFIFGFLSDRYGRKVALIPGISFSIISVIAILLPRQLNPLLVACIFVGAGASMNSMPNILISDLVPSGSLGTAIGTNRFFGDSGFFLGPLIVGSLLDHLGFRAPLYVILGFALFALALACFFVHNKPLRELEVRDIAPDL